MSQKIKSITEAFSMQPETFKVLETNIGYWKPEEAIKEIRLEQSEGVYNNEPEYYYRGYNFDGALLFQYIARTVNVQYFV